MAALNLSFPSHVAPATPAELPAALKDHLGDLIDQAGRLRMLSHRAVMFLALARDDGGGPEARAAFETFKRIAQRFLDLDAAGVTSPTAQAWLVEVVKTKAPAFGPAARRFLRDLAEVNADEGQCHASDLSRLADFVAGPLLEALNGLVSMLNAELHALGEAERRQALTAGATAANLLAEIEEIGAQVRMISINALIQATRAGESGAGFAVIANEIKDLAARMQSAARRITQDLQRALSGVG